MSSSHEQELELSPLTLLKAYACGIFPMAESSDDPSIFWVEPKLRGIIPLDQFHIPRSLKKSMRKSEFVIRFNFAFESVMKACAEETSTRQSTWINSTILDLYCGLHDIGHAHSVEVWLGDDLVGGLYGVSLGGAFFGESMFSRQTNASKIALVHLVRQLKNAGFSLLDTQFTTDHLARFGAIEVPRDDYRELLDEALIPRCNILLGIDNETPIAASDFS